MTDDNVFAFPREYRHKQLGYSTLKDLHQRPSIADDAFSTGWRELDAIWKLYGGQFTIVTGIAGHGKSTFLLNVICNMAKKEGRRAFLYVPENESHLRDKMKLIWGDDDGFDDFCENLCFVQSAMPDVYHSAPMDLTWVLDQAVIGIEKDWTSVLMIDPWNELEHYKPRDWLMTDYIRTCLMNLKKFSRSHNVAIILVAHPTKAVFENGGRIPTLADIEGSMNWYNKCDNGLVVVRNNDSGTTKIISAKVREHGAGKVGACQFYVDASTGRFTPQYAGDVRE